MNHNLYRGFTLWRKNLSHINKTRDNHFRLYGKYFDMTLVIKENYGSHIADSGLNIVQIKTHLGGLSGFLEFYFKAIAYYIKSHREKPYDFILSPIGEEPIGRFISIFYPKVCLVFDLWDIPGSSLKSTKITLKEILRFIYKFVLYRVIKQGDIVICGVLRNGISGFHIDDSKIIDSENGVLLKTFNPVLYEPNFDLWTHHEQEIRLLYLGYLHIKRGAGELIDVVKRLLDKGVSCQLLMVGPSDDEAIRDIISKRAECNLEDNVILHNELASNSVPEVILGADVCLCPLENIDKYKWSYPVKVYEYLALGKAIVASRLPGTEKLIQHNYNGLLYNPGDLDSFEHELTRMLDKTLRQKISVNARMSVHDKDWEIIVGRLSRNLSSRLDECHK